ncbi:hypothetical protein GCM10009744_45650 [Kribbella alba]|uniref:DUF4386 family protein n=1 Tax=Kribbella alba TaxID=190197 RepID=A0ABP4RGX2_9ACTN
MLGVAAGLGQVTFGARIPEWSGAKQAPTELGLLTVALSLIAGFSAILQRRTARPDGNNALTVGTRAACALGLIGPGLLCLTTVGRLWYLPAVALVTAGVLTVESWRLTVAVVAADWPRVLLCALGACQLLMAAGAAPAPMLAGAIGGLALIVAAWLRTPSRAMTWGLVFLGTVPFAVLAWTAIVPLLITVEAIAVAATIPRRRTT